jgi:exonuclease VII small subunit
MWKKSNDDVGPQPVANTLTEYKEALEEFSSKAGEFLSHIPLLTDARDAYQRAIAVSSQLRRVLDSGDETLRLVMGQLEQAVNTQLNQTTSDKRKTEAVKVGTTASNDDKADAARA